ERGFTPREALIDVKAGARASVGVFRSEGFPLLAERGFTPREALIDVKAGARASVGAFRSEGCPLLAERGVTPREALVAVKAGARTPMMTAGVTRRDFVAAAGGAAMAALIPGQNWARAAGARRRYAVVGTGIRGSTMWGRDLVERYADVLEFVG